MNGKDKLPWVQSSRSRVWRARRPEFVIEVAESSLSRDLWRKANSYARAGIPEYWVENLVDDTIEVFRDPVEGRVPIPPHASPRG